MRHPRVTPVMGVVYGLVQGLSSKQPYCTASNRWMEENYGLTARQVQHSLTTLIELGLIKRKIVKDPADKNKTRRYLRCNPPTSALHPCDVPASHGCNDPGLHGCSIDKKENNKEIEKPSPSFSTHNDVLQYWIKYRASQGDMLSELTIHEIKEEWNNRPLEDFKAAVKHSVRSSWKGIFPPERETAAQREEKRTIHSRPKAQVYVQPETAQAQLSRDETKKLLKEAFGGVKGG
jgi:hypothetical protein